MIANDAYVDLEWNPAPAEQGVVTYEISYRVGVDATVSTLMTTQTKVRIAGLGRDKPHDFNVIALNSEGKRSGYSTSVTITTAIDTTAPAVPVGAHVVATSRGANFFWSANTEPDIYQYEVAVSLAGATFTSLGYMQGTSYVYHAPLSVASGTIVQLKVRALDTSGNASDWSVVNGSVTFPLEAAAIGSLRYATVVVAAHNSLHPADADFVCDGVADEVEINAAIASLTLGGKVLLMEGHYITAGSITQGSATVLEGMGNQSTRVMSSGGVAYEMIVGSGEVRNLTLEWNSPNSAGMAIIHGPSVDNCIFYGDTSATNPPYCVLTDGFEVFITNNHMFGDQLNGIKLDGCQMALVSGNRVDFCETGIELVGNTYQNMICNNVIEGGTAGISLVATSFGNIPIGNTITGNSIVCNPFSGTQPGIVIDGGKSNVVTGNYIETDNDAADGIQLLATKSDCTLNSVIGNNIEDATGHGISLTANGGTHHIQNNNVSANVLWGINLNGLMLSGDHVIDNLVANNVVTRYGVDGIHIESGASTNMVQGNQLRTGILTGYGVNVADAGCAGNVTTNNDLRTSGATGSYNDAGTGTVKNMDGSANNWNLL